MSKEIPAGLLGAVRRGVDIHGTDLDLLDMIKLVNYIRALARDERHRIHKLEKSDFEDDKYLQPVLEDDPVLYSLEEIVVDGQPDQQEGSAGASVEMPQSFTSPGPDVNGNDDSTYREKLQGMNQTLEKSMQQLDLTRKALDKANENADAWKAKYEALSQNPHTTQAHTGSEKSQFDDPYAGKCPSLPHSTYASNMTSNPSANAPGQSPHRRLPRLYPGQRRSLHGTDSPRCRLWHWHLVHVLRTGRRCASLRR